MLQTTVFLTMPQDMVGRVHLEALVQATIWPRMLFTLLVSSHRAHLCFSLSSVKLCLTTQSNLTFTSPGLTSLNSSHPKGVIVYCYCYTFDNNSASPPGEYALREHKHMSSHVTGTWRVFNEHLLGMDDGGTDRFMNEWCLSMKHRQKFLST